MKVLIIGGNSALGIELRKTLSLNFEVFTAGRSNCDIYFDLSADSDMEINFKFDIVILAAAVFGGTTLKAYEENIMVNVLGTARSIKLANICEAKHFILISSMSIFSKHISPNYEIYCLTKKHSEEVAEFVTDSIKMPLTILRPSQLYSENESFKKNQQLLYKIIECAQLNENIIFHGTKNSIRNYLHVRDFTEIINRVIYFNVLGKYNCVNTESVTLIETFCAAISVFKSNCKYFFDNSKEDIYENIVQPDFDFFKKIDFKPRINIRIGIEIFADLKKRT